MAKHRYQHHLKKFNEIVSTTLSQISRVTWLLRIIYTNQMVVRPFFNCRFVSH